MTIIKYAPLRNRSQSGFALPAIILIATTTLILSTTAIQSAFAYRSLLDVQYYYGLAREAAQAGVVYAMACYKVRGASVTTLNPIVPNTNCTSGTSGSAYVTQGTNVRTSFSVTTTITTGTYGEIMRAVSTGTANLTTSSGTVVRTYQQNIVRSTAGGAKDILGITADRGTVFTMTSVRQAYGVGRNTYGQVGVNNNTSPQLSSTPFQLTSGLTAVKVMKEDDVTLVLASDGQVYSAGANNYGQMGNGSVSASGQWPPTKFNLPGSLTAKDAFTDGDTTWVIASDGKVYGAGLNSKGQIGNGDTSGANVTTPQLFNITLAPSVTALAMSGNGEMLLVLASDGNVYGAGKNQKGQLGNNTTTSGTTAVPVRYLMPSGVSIVDIETNNYDSFVLGSNGTVYGAGDNPNGYHGNGSTSDITDPRTGIFGLPGGVTAAGILAGDKAMYVIGSNGSVYSAGLNSVGQLGNGTTTSSSTYVTMLLPSGVTAVSITAEDNDAFILGSDGKVYGTGNNANGQLGNGTTTNVSDPRTGIFGLPSGVLAKAVVSDGDDATFVLGSDGNLYCAGNNLDGYFSYGVSGQKYSTPVQFGLPSGMKAYQPVSPTIIF